jgi:hypothetical protein
MSTYPGASYLPPQLKWLGLPDFRNNDFGPNAPYYLLRHFLPLCTKLETLSIRGDYRAEGVPSDLTIHDHVCEFIEVITTLTPKSVTALELRLSIPFLDKLIDAIRAKSGLEITRIGIDLGAWVQIYPIRNTLQELSDNRL